MPHTHLGHLIAFLFLIGLLLPLYLTFLGPDYADNTNRQEGLADVLVAIMHSCLLPYVLGLCLQHYGVLIYLCVVVFLLSHVASKTGDFLGTPQLDDFFLQKEEITALWKLFAGVLMAVVGSSIS